MALRQAVRSTWVGAWRGAPAAFPALAHTVPTSSFLGAAGGEGRPLPAAARVLLQQLRSKHHGKRAQGRGKGAAYTPPWEQKAARKAAAAAEDVADLPELKFTLRKLQVLVHPDKFHQNEEARQANTDSLAALQGFLSTIRNLEGQYPPANHQKLHFYVKNEDGSTREIKAQMRTTGGNCRNLVESQLGQLFLTCGLPERFKWDAESWTMKDAPEQPQHRSEDEFVPGQSTAAPDYNFVNPHKPKQPPSRPAAPSAAAPSAAAQPEMPEVQELPAGASHDNLAPGIYKQPIDFSDDEEVEEANLERAFEEYGALLEALAAVQWYENDDERDTQVRITAVDRLEELGWKVRPALNRLWGGERDEEVLTGAVEDLDPNSRAMIVRILAYALALEEEHGPPVRVLQMEQ